MIEDILRPSDKGPLLSVRVSPGARKTAVEGLYSERALKLRVAAPPVDGKANAEVERFLSAMIGVRRSRVSVAKGVSSRDKVVLFREVEMREVRQALGPHVG